MEINGNNFKQKLSKKYCCLNCNYITDRKHNLTNHNLSSKHIMETNGNEIKQNLSKLFACDICCKTYLTNSGLWKHKKTCCNNAISTNLIMELIKDNKDMKQLILEQNNTINNTIIHLVKNGTNNTNITNNNSNNKTFNLQVFLNETCKDAMNMSEFIENIKIQLPDLEKMGEIGYVQGLSNIINNNLKTLDITQRPVHCTDQKRETIYIKNDNIWEKEDDNKTKLRKAINKIAVKNIKALPQFREKYPDYHNSSLKISDTYDKLVLETMGGVGDENQQENKIIHNISKCITIDSSIKHSTD
jgi:hypothetical protein